MNKKGFISIVTLIFLVITLIQTDNAASTKVITDIKNWNHPVKKVMIDNKINISKVELLKNNTYPIFYVKFPVELKYANKEYFDNIERKIAEANGFWDYKMVDKSKNVSIEVFCNKDFKNVKYAQINGKKNYFMLLQQKEAISNYNYIKPISIKSINSTLNKIIKSGWDSNFQKILGSPDSYFNKYSIYFKKGIKVDARQKVFNIVFDTKFKEKVVNDITMKSSKSEIIKSLGTPQFVSKDNSVIGYKADKFYIFFILKNGIKEVSIYRRDTGYNKKIIKEIIEGYNINSSYDKYEYLISKWPSYDLIYNERGGYGALYYSAGVFISNDGDYVNDLPNIRIYGNYEGDITNEISLPGKIKKLNTFSKDLVLLELDKDAIWEREKYRIEDDKQVEKDRTKNGVLSPDGSKRAVENDGGTYEHAGIYILSVNKNSPDVEFSTPHFPSNIQWLNSRYLLYSVYLNGIYVYDTQKGKVIGLEPEDEYNVKEYKLISVKDGKIAYKDTLDDKLLAVKYKFDKNGNIVFNR